MSGFELKIERIDRMAWVIRPVDATREIEVGAESWAAAASRATSAEGALDGVWLASPFREEVRPGNSE